MDYSMGTPVEAPKREYGYDRQVYQGLLDRGFKPAAAAGIAGNAFAESAYNQNNYNPAGGGQGALGMFQWRGDRQKNFLNYLAQSGRNKDDIGANLDFLVHEMQNNPEHAMLSIDEINALTDPVAAGNMFRSKFERPGQDTGGYKRTTQEAARVYNAYSGLDPINLSELDMGEALGYGKKSSALTGFADDADARSRNLQAMALQMGDSLDAESRMLMEAMIPGNYGATLAKANGAQQPQGGQQGGLSFSTSGSGGEVGYSAGTPADKNPEEEPDKKPSLMERIFPRREEDVRPDAAFWERSSFADALAALGIGLSQASHGQAPDASAFLGNMHNIRQGRVNAAAENARADQQLLIDEQNAATAAIRASLEDRRLNLDMEKFNNDVEIEKRNNEPLTADFLEAAATQFPSLSGLAMDLAGNPTPGGKALFLDAYKDLVTKAPATPTRSIGPQGMAVMEQFTPETTPEQVERMVSTIPDPDTRKELRDVAKAIRGEATDGSDEDSVTKRGRSLFAEDQRLPPNERMFSNERDALLHAAKTNAGLESKSNEDTYQFGVKMQQDAIKSYDTAMATDPLLDTMLDATFDIVEQGGEPDEIVAPMIATAQKMASSLGFSSIADALEQQFGYSDNDLRKLDESQHALSLILSRPLMEGTGSITNEERANVLKTVANAGQSNAVRLEAIAKARALNAFDRHVAQRLVDPAYNTFTPGNANAQQVYSELQFGLRPHVSKIAQAAGELMLFQAAGNLNEPKHAWRSKATQLQMFQMASPTLTREEVEMLRPIMIDPRVNVLTYRGHDGALYSVKTNERLLFDDSGALRRE